MTNVIQQLMSARYLGGVIFLLGMSFQLSTAATNIFFYLLVISGLIIMCSTWGAYRALYCQIFTAPLWRLITIWVVLLYLSALYSSADALLWQYAKKYLKYLLLFFIIAPVLLQKQREVDLPKRFFRGFAYGAGITFILSLINKATGLLTYAAHQDWVSLRYVSQGYWVSIEWFAHAIFMAVLFAYGLTTWLRTRQLSALFVCAIGLFEVFVVSDQRTGFIALTALALWLIWLRFPTLKLKALGLLCTACVIAGIAFTDNGVSARFQLASHEWQRCAVVDDMGQTQDLQALGKACYSSIGLRKMFYHDSLQRIGQSWLYGHGLGNLNIQSLSYDWSTKSYGLKKLENPHNEYLLQGIQLGFIGIVLLISLFISAYKEAMKLGRQRQYLYAGIVLMYAVSCLFNSFLLDTLEGLFFTMLIAFITVERLHQVNQEKA